MSIDEVVDRIMGDPTRITMVFSCKIAGRSFSVRAWRCVEGAVGLYVRPQVTNTKITGGKHASKKT